jgi:cytochrome c5
VPSAGIKAIVAALALAALMGCDDKQTSLTPVTLDARLQGIYSRTCVTCHANAETGAPQAHDTAAWKPRLAQGDEVLLTHMIEGFNGMPPLGQCIECNADDLKNLMHFMAAPASQDAKDTKTKAGATE